LCTVRLGIVSGGNPARYRSHINHSVYAGRYGLSYRRNTIAYPDLQTPHFHKLHAIAEALPEFDWVLWLDDDAFFTDFDKDMRDFLVGLSSEVLLVVCRSPINLEGNWTFLNTGVFFIRNDPEAIRLLWKVDAAPKPLVEKWWDPKKVGILTPGEQLHLIYVLHRDQLLPRIKLFDYTAFNARYYHYKTRPDEHRIVHFAGVPERGLAIKEFGDRFGMDESLVPSDCMRMFGADAKRLASFE